MVNLNPCYTGMLASFEEGQSLSTTKLLSWATVLMLWHFTISDVLGWDIFFQDLYFLANWGRPLEDIACLCAFVFKKQLPKPRWIVMMWLEVLCCRMWRFIDEFIECQVILPIAWGYDLMGRNHIFKVSPWYTRDWEPLPYLKIFCSDTKIVSTLDTKRLQLERSINS